MYKNTLLRICKPYIFWLSIFLYTLIPGSSYFLVAQATFKLDLPSNKKWLKRLKRYLRIIYTSPKKVVLVCVADFIISNGVIIAILFAMLNSLYF